jgi:hypothetical protein
METNAAHIPPAFEPFLLARARPFEPDPPAVDGTCGRCGFHGAVYPGRYGGRRCAVYYGLQNGWMPSGEL